MVFYSGKRAHNPDLETLVLEHALNSSVLPAWRELGLENNAKGSVSYDLALSVLHLPSFTGNAILDFLANHLCKRETCY